MDNSAALNPTTEEEVALAEAIKEIFQQIERANERMEKDQEDIDRLKVETRAMLDTLKTVA